MEQGLQLRSTLRRSVLCLIERVKGLQAYVIDMLSDYIAIACLVWYFLVLIVCAIGVFQMY